MVPVGGPWCGAVSVAELVSLYSFDEGVVEDVLMRLIKSQHLAGTLRARDYVPHVFSRTQRECVNSFFAQNGYIEFSRAQKLQVGPPCFLSAEARGQVACDQARAWQWLSRRRRRGTEGGGKWDDSRLADGATYTDAPSSHAGPLISRGAPLPGGIHSLSPPDSYPFPGPQIHKPLEYVRQSFPDALGLEKLVVSASLLHSLEANLEEAVANRTYLDTMAVLPPILSKGETAGAG
jgi:hypothetical protein